MIYARNADGSDQIIEAKGEAYGVNIWTRTYRGTRPTEVCDGSAGTRRVSRIGRRGGRHGRHARLLAVAGGCGGSGLDAPDRLSDGSVRRLPFPPTLAGIDGAVVTGTRVVRGLDFEREPYVDCLEEGSWAARRPSRSSA